MNITTEMAFSIASSTSLRHEETVNRAKDITICSLMGENSKLRKSCKDLRQRLVVEKKQHLRFKIENTKQRSQLLSTNRQIQSKYSDIQKHFQKMKSKCVNMEKCLENILDINVDSVKQSAMNDRVVVDITESVTESDNVESQSDPSMTDPEHAESSSSDQTVDNDVDTPNDIKSDPVTPTKRKRSKTVKERNPVRRSRRKRKIKKY